MGRLHVTCPVFSNEMQMLFTLIFCSCLPFLLAAPLEQSVIVGYYAESLCPDCIAFSTKHMDSAIKEIGDIFVLDYVPWGNARLIDGKFECQHGEMECIVNTIDACLLKYYPQREKFWPFIYCMDKQGSFQSPKVAERCAQENNLVWDKINTCYSGQEGHDLELMYYNKTASLQPPHKYTPWVTIDGKHDSVAEGVGLIRQICDAYKGTDKPKRCSI